MKRLRVLMASSEERVGRLFREVIEGVGRNLTIIDIWPEAEGFHE